MNKRKLIEIITFFSTIAVLCGLLLSTGCETADDPESDNVNAYFKTHPFVSDPRSSSRRIVSISPEKETVVAAGEKFVFTASGGTGAYTWDVAIPGNGSVAMSNWHQGVYTANSVSPNSVIVYDRDGYAAIAVISADKGGGTALSASANPSSIGADGGKSVLVATGGTPPYTWTVHDVALGNISSPTGTSILYTRSNPGDNGVRVTDSQGASVYIVILQP